MDGKQLHIWAESAVTRLGAAPEKLTLVVVGVEQYFNDRETVERNKFRKRVQTGEEQSVPLPRGLVGIENIALTRAQVCSWAEQIRFSVIGSLTFRFTTRW